MCAGRDHRRDPLPVHLHGDPLPALPVPLALLGGVLPLFGHATAHHVQEQPQGAILNVSRANTKGEKRHRRGVKKDFSFPSAEEEEGKCPDVQIRREHFQEVSCIAGSIFQEAAKNHCQELTGELELVWR